MLLDSVADKTCVAPPAGPSECFTFFLVITPIKWKVHCHDIFFALMPSRHGGGSPYTISLEDVFFFSEFRSAQNTDRARRRIWKKAVIDAAAKIHGQSDIPPELGSSADLATETRDKNGPVDDLKSLAKMNLTEEESTVEPAYQKDYREYLAMRKSVVVGQEVPQEPVKEVKLPRMHDTEAAGKERAFSRVRAWLGLQ